MSVLDGDDVADYYACDVGVADEYYDDDYDEYGD